MNTRIFLIFLLLVQIFSGCKIHEDGSIRSKGEIIRFSEKEILENKERLLNPDPKEIEKAERNNSETSSLFDGKATSIEIRDNGLRIVNFDIERVIAGIIKNRKHIEVLTPAPEKGGMDFEEGKRYRVLTLFENDAYRTWNFLAVALPH